MTVPRLKSNHAVHEEVCPGHVYLVTDMGLGVPRLRKDVDALTGSVPVVFRIGEMEVGVPYFDMIIRRETGLEVPGETHHILPSHDIHVSHMNMIRGEEVFKGVGCFTIAIATV